jgi:hypothetical protein
LKALRNDKDNVAYYLALLDWGEVLESKKLYKFGDQVVPHPRKHEDGWRTSNSLKWTELNGIVRDAKIGFYHSRLIFQFNLKETPENIDKFREIREKITERVEEHLDKKVIKTMEEYLEKEKKPKVFFYPIFEIREREAFWKGFGEKKPYSSATTCFYIELDDPKGRKSWLQLPLIGQVVSVLYPKKVRMRVSGGSVITTEMSDWFFWNLTNIIFHEGLYRQSRPIGLSKDLFETKGVYYGLENRLEDFASGMIETFHDLSSIRIRGVIAQIALVVSIFALLFATVPMSWAFRILIVSLILYVIFWLLRGFWRKYRQCSTPTA